MGLCFKLSYSTKHKQEIQMQLKFLKVKSTVRVSFWATNTTRQPWFSFSSSCKHNTFILPQSLSMKWDLARQASPGFLPGFSLEWHLVGDRGHTSCAAYAAATPLEAFLGGLQVALFYRPLRTSLLPEACFHKQRRESVHHAVHGVGHFSRAWWRMPTDPRSCWHPSHSHTLPAGSQHLCSLLLLPGLSDGRSIWRSHLTSWPSPIIWWLSQGYQMRSRRLSETSWVLRGVLRATETLKSLQGSIHLPEELCELQFRVRCAILRNHPTFQAKLV